MAAPEIWSTLTFHPAEKTLSPVDGTARRGVRERKEPVIAKESICTATSGSLKENEKKHTKERTGRKRIGQIGKKEMNASGTRVKELNTGKGRMRERHSPSGT